MNVKYPIRRNRSKWSDKNRSVWLCLAVLFAALHAWSGSHVTDEGFATHVERPVSVRTLDNGHALLDFGRNAAGYVQFEAKEASDYRFVIGELLNADGTVVARDAGEKWGCSFTWVRGPDGRDYRTSVRYIDVAARVESAGTCRVPFAFKWQKRFDTAASVKAHPKAIGDVMTFRYLEVVVPPKGVRPSEICRARVNADFNWDDSSFVSSDATLNAVYDLCKWTVQADSYLGFWVDGDRERKLYEADQYVIQNVAAALFADNRVTRRSVRALLGDRHARNGIFEWQQFIPLLAFSDWFNSGDAETVSDSAVWRDILSCVRTDREAEDGVLSVCATDFASLVDHPPENLYDYDGGALNALKRVISDGRRLPVENALHYASLKALAQMSSARGEAKKAAAYEARAAKTFRGFNEVFFDPAVGLYRDRVMTNGYVSAHHSTLANAYALAFDLVPAACRDRVADFVATNRVADGLAASPFAAYFVLEGLCKAGRADAAIAYMTATNRNSWVNMMREGLTTAGETWSLFSSVVSGNYYDLSHAWGTAPAYIASRYVLGVRPASPGFATAVVAPQFGSLAWARGTVPTPKGGVTVSYTNGTLTVRLPPAMASATVSFAGRTRTASGGATVVIGAEGGTEFSHDTYEGRIMVVGDSIFATGPKDGHQWEILRNYYPRAKVDCCAANGMRGDSVYARCFMRRSDDALRATDAIVFRIGINDNWFGDAFEKGYSANDVRDRVAFTDALGHLNKNAAGYVVRMASRARQLNPRVLLFLEPYMVYLAYGKEAERHINGDMRRLADSGLGFVYVDGHPYGGDNLNNAALRFYQTDYIHHAPLRHEFEGDWLARWLEPHLARGVRVRRSVPDGHAVLLAGDASAERGRLAAAFPKVSFTALDTDYRGIFSAVTNLSEDTVRNLDLAVIRAGRGATSPGNPADAMPQKPWRAHQCFPRNLSGIDMDAHFAAAGVRGYGIVEMRSVGPEVIAEPPHNTLRGLKDIRQSLVDSLKLFMLPAARKFVPGCVARLQAMNDDRLRAELVPGFRYVRGGVTNEITSLSQYWRLFDDSPCGELARTAFYLRLMNPRVKIVFLAYGSDATADAAMSALADRSVFNWPFVKSDALADELYLQLMTRTTRAVRSQPPPPDKRIRIRPPASGTRVVKYDGKDHRPDFKSTVTYSVDYSAEAFVRPGSYDVTFTVSRHDLVRWADDGDNRESIYKIVIEE